MLTKEKNQYSFPALASGSDCLTLNENARLEVTGKGSIQVRNTGGSSASEGGMGSGSNDDREQGDLKKPGEKSGTSTTNEDAEGTFDPIKKNIKEAEKENSKEGS